MPHWEAGEIPQSITFRLHDSLPRELLDHWRSKLQTQATSSQQIERRKQMEAALDDGHGQCHLRQPAIADMVEHTLRHFDGARYRLHAWCIMPNHVHILVTLWPKYPLSSTLHTWKSFSAKKANSILNRKGEFWQAEYFDRAIRNEDHFVRTLEYIENNPIKAGLCQQATEWCWSSAKREIEIKAAAL
ncbi:MAG: transposase [Mariprofundales bacterium]